MGKDKKEEEYSYVKTDTGTDPKGYTITREKVESSLVRKKFHYEGGRWFCNICNDIGRVDPARDLMKCQGCGVTETSLETAD